MAQRKADSLELSCVQRLRAWERKHTSPVIRRTITVLCTGLFVYRLLQLSQWSHSLIVSRGLPSPHTVKAADDQALWLPQSWIGHPEPLDPLACIPQLLIIGVMKGGTTALFHYLNGSEPAIHYPNGTKSPVQFKSRFHPAIIGSHVTKELHFFDKLPAHIRTAASQQKYFASFAGVDMTVDDPLDAKCSYPAKRGLTKGSRPELIRMEATAMYLAHPHAAGNVKMLLQQARLVALLREPVSRAMSSVNMLFQRSPLYDGLKENTPEYNRAWQQYVVTQLRNQLHTLQQCSSSLKPDQPLYSQVDHCVFAATGNLQGVLHIHVGLYAVHLERWFTHFQPEQLLIWSSHAFEQQPKEHMQQLVEWLGLDSSLIQQDSQSFQKLHERSYPSASLPGSLFEELIQFFEPYNQRLFTLLEEKGYRGLMQQLKTAWELELQQTMSALQQS